MADFNMSIVQVCLIILVTGQVAYGVDPSSCQRLIKFKLIDACGANKREFQQLPLYKVMSNDEIDMRYYEMVKTNMIKGVDSNNIVEYEHNSENSEDPDITQDLINQLYYSRFKRSFIGVKIIKPYAEPINHEKLGSFHFVGRLPVEIFKSLPPPGELKRKCCGDGSILCTTDDFKGFCG